MKKFKIRNFTSRNVVFEKYVLFKKLPLSFAIMSYYQTLWKVFILEK